MKHARRLGDLQGISFLLALVVAAFIPTTLDEAGKIVEALEARRAGIADSGRGGDAAPRQLLLKPSSLGASVQDLEREVPRQTGVPSALCRVPAAPVSILTVLDPGASLPRHGGEERRREPRGPPPA